MLFILGVVAIYGLIVGSFLNAVVWRLRRRQRTENAAQKQPKGKGLSEARFSITRGRSMCPECQHQLRWYDLVPVVSWLLLGGKCRDCRQPISWQYPVVELMTAALFALSWQALHPANALQIVMAILWLAMLSMLIVLTIYDLRWMILPDAVMFPAIVLAAVLVVAQVLTTLSPAAALSPLAAAVVAGGAFYALAAVSNGRWMGGGDIKLAFLMGLLLGLSKVAVALFLGFNSAALVGLMLMAMRRKKRTDLIPFGPFLAAATVVAYLYGQPIINWYLSAGLHIQK